MLRRSLVCWKKAGGKEVKNTAESLAKRIQSELDKEGVSFAKAVKPCAVRLLYHQAHQDPYLAKLPPSAFVATVNRSLACLSQHVAGSGRHQKKAITMPMMRVFLDEDEEPVGMSKQRVSNYSANTDRNYYSLRSEYTGQGGGAAKRGCFYEHLTKGWSVCDDIDRPELRVATIYNLISMFGFKSSYSAAQLQQAKAKVGSKSERYVRTFAYVGTREEYSRRRLLTDGALHEMLRNASPENLRRVAWILFFDSTYQRFPRRPKKQPSPQMLVLWREWMQRPMARSMPFLERFVALMSQTHLDQFMDEARAKGDAKFRHRAKQRMAKFAHRQERSLVVERSAYDASAQMAKKKLTLSTLAYKLQYQRQASVELSSQPTYVAVLKTSKAIRSPAAAKVLLQAQSDSCDRGFSYASHDM